MANKKRIIAVINGKGFVKTKSNTCGGEVSVAYVLYNNGEVKYFGPEEAELEERACILIKPYSLEQAKKLLKFKQTMKSIYNQKKASSE